MRTMFHGVAFERAPFFLSARKGMTDNDLKAAVTRLAAPVVTSLGLVIWGVEVLRAGRTVVRLFVDVPSPGGAPCPIDLPARTDGDEQDMAALSASLDQCEEISRHLGLALEVEDVVPEAYVLEVSTPGLTRLFFCLAQMRPYLGSVVEARLLEAVDVPGGGHPRRLWRGVLDAVEDDAFVLSPATISPEGLVEPEDVSPVRIPWHTVRRACRMYIFAKPQKPGKGPKRAPNKPERGKQTVKQR